jgi:hypothetical protein
MPRVHVLDLDFADETTTGIATGLTGAGPFTTFTASGPTDGIAHQLSLTSAANISAITLTLVGTDADGIAQTEAVTGPNATTVETTGYFLTLTSITASSTLGANTMDVGWVDEISSRTIPLNRHSEAAARGHIDVTGTCTFSVQYTMVPFNDVFNIWPKTWVAGTPNGGTADTAATAVVGATGIRVVTNSYSSGAELQLFYNEVDT